MNKLLFMQGKTVFILVADGVVSIARRPCGSEKEICAVIVKGSNIGNSLVVAGRKAGLYDTDIAYVAHCFQLALPVSAGIIDILEPRGQANRFTPVPT